MVQSFEYRVIRTPVHSYSLAEVYYNADKDIVSYSCAAVSPSGETLDELRADVAKLNAALERPVLDVNTFKELEETELQEA